jgi:16S rRNA C967 or C1407 C5-methylase (RsmB/RsmF family)
MNGFQLVKPDGNLVYSTCSLLPAQNQLVVLWLLLKCGADATLDDIPFRDMLPNKLTNSQPPVTDGYLANQLRRLQEQFPDFTLDEVFEKYAHVAQKTLQIYPDVYYMDGLEQHWWFSGMFIARIKRAR